jgi:hypothetical protein
VEVNEEEEEEGRKGRGREEEGEGTCQIISSKMGIRIGRGQHEHLVDGDGISFCGSNVHYQT